MMAKPCSVERPEWTYAAQHVAELSAILGVAYEAFLRTRLERRRGGRGKVHRRGLVTAIEMVVEMIAEAGGGDDPDELWRVAVAELDRERGDIEADVLAQHGFLMPEHEWTAFLEWASPVVRAGR